MTSMMKMIGLAAAIGFIVWMAIGMVAFAQPKTTDIILLLGQTCAKIDLYTMTFPDAQVGCAPETNWVDAHVHYAGFEQYFNMIYVIPSHVKHGTDAGYARWTGNGSGYAWADEFPEVVHHEQEHLDCQCLYTPDGVHGTPSNPRNIGGP